MNSNQSAENKSFIFLDTNAFYDCCYLLGFNDFSFKCGINQRVNYDKFKDFILSHLQSQTLFIPATTLFEFVCKFRDDGETLDKIIVFLKQVSYQYGYNLFQYHNNGILFMLDQYDEVFWNDLQKDYSEILKWKDIIMRAKIGSESFILTIFCKLISHLYLVDYFKNEPKYEHAISLLSNSLKYYYFSDSEFYFCRNVIAREMYKYYKIGKEYEIKKDIVEMSLDYCSINLLTFFTDFNSNCDDEKYKIIETSDSIQTNIHKWYNNEKDLKFLEGYFIKFKELLQGSGFNDSQICYIKKVVFKLFTQGAKREKNDAEDFWNLYFVDGDFENLITFELEIIEAIKQTNESNYQAITSFYNVSN